LLLKFAEMQRAAFFGIFALGLMGLGAVACTHPYGDAPNETHTTDDTVATPDKSPLPTKKPATTNGATSDAGAGTSPVATSPITKPGGGGGGDAGSSGSSTSDGGAATIGGSCVGSPTAGGDAYVIPRAHQTGACSNSDVGFYDGLLVQPGETYKSIKAAMTTRNPACASCMFSQFTDTAWGPIVMEDDTNGFFNWGACYTYANGGSPACGSQAQQWFDCLGDVCASCVSDADLAACQNQAAADPKLCANLPMDACGTTANLDTLNAECSTMALAIAAACE
jgi:hypothetical protein